MIMTHWNIFVCIPGEKPDPDHVFRLSALQNSSIAPPPPSVSPAHNPSHRLDTALMETPQDTLVRKTHRLSCSSAGVKAQVIT